MKFCYQHKIFRFISLHDEIKYNERCDTSDVYSFLWISQGILNIKINNEEHLLKSPCILCIPPNKRMEILSCKELQYMFQYNSHFYSIIQGDKEIATSGLLFHNVFYNKPLKVSSSLKKRLQILVKSLFEQMETQDELQEEVMRIILKSFIIIATRLAQKQIFEKPTFFHSQFTMFREFIYLVDKHFKEHHQVKFYANQLHKAPKSLTNQFALLDLPKPQKIIHERIMLEAKHLLLNTSLSFSEIAFMLGFEELSQFSRFFKTKLGVSPSTFRKNN